MRLKKMFNKAEKYSKTHIIVINNHNFAALCALLRFFSGTFCVCFVETDCGFGRKFTKISPIVQKKQLF